MRASRHAAGFRSTGWVALHSSHANAYIRLGPQPRPALGDDCVLAEADLEGERRATQPVAADDQMRARRRHGLPGGLELLVAHFEALRVRALDDLPRKMELLPVEGLEAGAQHRSVDLAQQS